MDRNELLQVATQLMAALIVDERIAWFKDGRLTLDDGTVFETDLAHCAVRCAKTLIERVDHESSKSRNK